MCVFLFYVREAADKYLKKATSLANSIVKEEVLKLPLITFCPGIKNEQLRVGTDISGTNEALFTYFDFSENGIVLSRQKGKKFSFVLDVKF